MIDSHDLITTCSRMYSIIFNDFRCGTDFAMTVQ